MAQINNKKWQLKEKDFGPLLPYIIDDNVTDINYNGTDVWIDDLTKGRYKASLVLSEAFLNQFSVRISDIVNVAFNDYHVLLEAETDTLRISIVHPAVCNTGMSISIRKTPIVKRLNTKKMIDTNYCSKEMLDLLRFCIDGKMNMMMCGLPGTGKTELLKYLTGYIPDNERVITIEDNLELHYAEINPGKDCVEMKVQNSSTDKAQKFDYIMAIKACLRQNPQWILLSEARSTEVKYLIESMSTGTHCLTTIHTDDVSKVPDRIKNMIHDSSVTAQVENDVFSFLDVAVLIKKRVADGHIIRYIDQIAFFSREEKDGKSVNVIKKIADEGRVINREIPLQIMKKFQASGIENPFSDYDKK